MSRPNWFQRTFSTRNDPPQEGSAPGDAHELADTLDPYAAAPCIDDLDFQLSNGIKVKVTNEDVEDMEADVVVISNDRNLSNVAAAAQSLLKAGGESYEKSLRSLKKSIGRKDTVLRCDAGSGLKCKTVYHALFNAPYGGRNIKDWRSFLDELYGKTCVMALQDKAETVAVVLLGAGKAGGPTRESVRAALEAFSKLPQPGCLTQLLLVERDERRTREAVQECQTWTSEHAAPPQ